MGLCLMCRRLGIGLVGMFRVKGEVVGIAMALLVGASVAWNGDKSCILGGVLHLRWTA